MSTTFAIRRQSDALSEDIAHVLTEVGMPGKGSTVFIKPNFTYPFEKPGVTTTKRFLIALVDVLRDCQVSRICIGEGEGGYNAFAIEDTFAAYGLHELADSHGVECQNVNAWPSRTLQVKTRRGLVGVNVPAPIFDEFDHYISAPVPKVHCMTTISCAVKNQWGLVQDTLRLKRHTVFNEVITEITRQLPRPIAVLDGTFGLTRNGPMVDGVPLELGWVAACNDVFAHDEVICRLMKMPMGRVKHLRYAQQQGLLAPPDTVSPPQGLASFVDDRFYLRRNIWNRLAKTTWYSERLNHLVYISRVSGLLHRVMYSIRQKSPDLKVRGVDWD